MMRVLCIGGPNDGETHSMEDLPDRAPFRQLEWRARMLVRFNPNDCALPLKVQEIRSTVYEIATLHANGREFKLAAPAGTPIDTMIHALIQGYKN
jgi:hypothetical protein